MTNPNQRLKNLAIDLEKTIDSCNQVYEDLSEARKIIIKQEKELNLLDARIEDRNKEIVKLKDYLAREKLERLREGRIIQSYIALLDTPNKQLGIQKLREVWNDLDIGKYELEKDIRDIEGFIEKQEIWMYQENMKRYCEERERRLKETTD